MSTWLKSLWKAHGPFTSYRAPNGKARRYLSNTTFFREHHRVATDLVKQCGCIVAEVDGAEDEIAGYICAERMETVQGERFVVHYTYVKPLYRKLGIARWLLDAAGWKRGEDIVATHVLRQRLLITPGGQQENRHTEPVLLPNRFDQLETVEHGHVHIRDDQVD